MKGTCDLQLSPRMVPAQLLLFIWLTSSFVSAQPIDTIWIRHFGDTLSRIHFQNMVVHSTGSVYLTGTQRTADSDDDIVTMRYDADGTLLWAQHYNGPFGSDDRSTSLALDREGNIYVAGSSQNLATWLDYVIIKYAPDGDSQWVRTYDGPGHRNDVPERLVVDAAGNVYITGRSDGTDGYVDFATVKYRTDGSMVWTKRYDGQVAGLAVDAAGSVLAAGTSWSAAGDVDFLTIKYDSAGTEVWARRYDNDAHTWDQAADVAVDAAGNVYVTGHSIDPLTLIDYCTIKYSPNGALCWIRRYHETDSQSEIATGIVVDDEGNSYVTGEGGNVPGGHISTVKYDSGGNTIWMRSYGESDTSYLQAQSLSLDNSGNLYVSGSIIAMITSELGELEADVVTIKYGLSGEREWTTRFHRGYAGEKTDIGSYIVNTIPVASLPDIYGNVYVGTTISGVSWSYIALVKYGQAQLAVESSRSVLPSHFELLPNYPNPFNSGTTIRFGLPTESRVEIGIYNLLGQKVAVAFTDELGEGYHEVRWQANVPSGTYLYRMYAISTEDAARTYVSVKRMILLK